jgi:hypothetical protein
VQGGELIGVRGDVLIPSGSIWVLGGVWCGGDSLEGDNVGLGRSVTIISSVVAHKI